MDQSANHKMSRLELYLKNMDLLKINPSVTVSGINLDLTEKSDIHSFLNLLNDWSIRKLYLFDNIETLNPLINFFQNNGTNSIFKDIKIYLNLNLDEQNFIHSHRDHMDRLFQSKIFCTNQYYKHQKNWGEDIFYFHGHEPEIYTLKPEDKKLEVEIKYPEDVIGIYQWRFSEAEEFLLKNCTDILNKLDKDNGILRLRTSGDKISRIIVLRTCKIIFTDKPHYWLNFTNPKNLQLAREAHQLKLIESGATELDTIYNLNDLLSGMDFEYFPNLIYTKEKQSQLITNQPIIDYTLKRYLGNSQESEKAKLELILLYVKFIKEKFLSQFHVNKNNDEFLIDIDHPLINQLSDSIPVIPHIDLNRFLPGTTYTLNMIVNIRKLINTTFKAEKNTIQVSIDHLLNTRQSFNDKKFNIDYLVINGVNHLNYKLSGETINSSQKPLAKIKKWDPNFSAYSDWFAYQHQLGHFMKSGIRRPEALLLYPGLDDNLDIFYQTINELQNTGLDYHIIDFDTFNDHILCPVHDGNFILFNHNYRLLIVPAIKYIPIDSMQKINKFYTEGGIVVALGHLPEHTADGKNETLLQRIKKEIWLDESDTKSTMFKQHESDGLGYFQNDISRLKNVLTDLDKILRVHIKSSNPGIVYQLREHQEHYYLMVMNIDQKKTTNFNIETKYLGRPYYWDFDSAESYPYTDWYIRDKKLLLRLNLGPRESRFFIIDKKHSLKMYTLFDSPLDGCKLIQQDAKVFKMEGWQRKEGSFSITIQKSNEQRTLSYSVEKKLPILTFDSSGWFLDSDHFKGQVSLGDQSYPFPYKSAAVTYHKLFVLKKEYLKKHKLFLDLGHLSDWCILSINDTLVGRRIFAPWIFDVTGYLKAGENKVSIQIANSLSNAFANNDNLVYEKYYVQSYGLFGPVNLIPYSLITFKH